MALPPLITIVPPQEPVGTEITVPGSKSITNRALVLAALGEGEREVRGALWSDDTLVMVECLRELGFMVNVETEPNEVSNRTITVFGKGGNVPRGGSLERPLELFVGNAGTAARFLSALVCLGSGTYRLTGVERMHQRPQEPLLQALRQLGYRIDSPNGKLPAVIHGGGKRPGKCRVSIRESSQFASALMLCAEAGGWQVEVEGENAEESPYVRMTSEMIRWFANQNGVFQVEPDASSGSYFVGAGFLLGSSSLHAVSVTVRHWPASGWQVDEAFPKVVRSHVMLDAGLAAARGDVEFEPRLKGQMPEGTISRARDLGDSIMTAIVLAPFGLAPVRFSDLGRLRLQECERVAALRAELEKCGAKVIEEGDCLIVHPSKLHGAEIETYNDHRMAMCFGMLGLKVSGIRLRNPGCVKKTFPDFFQKLVMPAPHGLGARVEDSVTRQALRAEDLFAV